MRVGLMVIYRVSNLTDSTLLESLCTLAFSLVIGTLISIIFSCTQFFSVILKFYALILFLRFLEVKYEDIAIIMN